MRLIDDQGEQRGIMGTNKALELAHSSGKDLVEVSPNAHPPVCRIMDYGKHLYKQKKQEQTHKKSQKQAVLKGIRLSIRTGQHDLDTKIRQATKFLKSKNPVKISLLFKGREIIHKEMGVTKMNEFATALEEYADIETPPKTQGNTLMMILSPKKN